MPLDYSLVPLIALIGTPLFLFLLKPLAERIHLIDLPDNGRKRHNGIVPLTGGLAILLTLSAAFSVSSISARDLAMTSDFWPMVGGLLAFLVIAHAVDDILELNATTRLMIDGALALCICTWLLLKIATLGDLFGMGEVKLGRFAVFMTVFSFIAASNAYNMVDGIDSLCSGLGIITFGSLIAFLTLANDPRASALINVLAIIICALIPMYLANLGTFGPRLRSFLGDSGARLIGFMAAITVIMAATEGFIEPVYAFFPIALPVCDCLVLMTLRIVHGRSPFSADQMHLHNLLANIGLSFGAVRRIEMVLAVAIAVIGILLQISGVEEWVVSLIIGIIFAAYIVMRLWLTHKAHGMISG